jgi:hypothetical protein
MAKTTSKRNGGIKRQARRVIPAIRRRAAKQVAAAKMTLGDLIAAAFDTVGEVKDVAKVLTSPDLAVAIQKKIVLV